MGRSVHRTPTSIRLCSSGENPCPHRSLTVHAWQLPRPQHETQAKLVNYDTPPAAPPPETNETSARTRQRPPRSDRGTRRTQICRPRYSTRRHVFGNDTRCAESDGAARVEGTKSPLRQAGNASRCASNSDVGKMCLRPVPSTYPVSASNGPSPLTAPRHAMA